MTGIAEVDQSITLLSSSQGEIHCPRIKSVTIKDPDSWWPWKRITVDVIEQWMGILRVNIRGKNCLLNKSEVLKCDN